MTEKIRELLNKLRNEIEAIADWEELYRISTEIEDVSDFAYARFIELHEE